MNHDRQKRLSIRKQDNLNTCRRTGKKIEASVAEGFLFGPSIRLGKSSTFTDNLDRYSI